MPLTLCRFQFCGFYYLFQFAADDEPCRLVCRIACCREHVRIVLDCPCPTFDIGGIVSLTLGVSDLCIVAENCRSEFCYKFLFCIRFVPESRSLVESVKSRLVSSRVTKFMKYRAIVSGLVAELFEQWAAEMRVSPHAYIFVVSVRASSCAIFQPRFLTLPTCVPITVWDKPLRTTYAGYPTLSAVIMVHALKRVLYDTRHNYSVFKVQLTTEVRRRVVICFLLQMWTRDVSALCMVSPCQLPPTDRFCLKDILLSPQANQC